MRNKKNILVKRKVLMVKHQKQLLSYAKLGNERRMKLLQVSIRREVIKLKAVSMLKDTFTEHRESTDAGNRGKKSTKPSWHSLRSGESGSGMTQSDRDYARGQAEYGHTGYDPDGDGGPSDSWMENQKVKR
jgi:hypothetical protein